MHHSPTNFPFFSFWVQSVSGDIKIHWGLMLEYGHFKFGMAIENKSTEEETDY